ncbi:MAG: hypothetical protein KC776_05590 [Myxococcales bacterium]|nr:hypothetical protein [Myxococcales bacterium]MCB9580717.1 hypothetical protein [Polyangiaceae bacterium]
MDTRRTSSWKPRIAHRGPRYAVFAFATEPHVRGTWSTRVTGSDAAFVAAFLNRQLQLLKESELTSDASFLYVVLRSAAQHDDELAVTQDGPVAELGYGRSPRAPDIWPLLEVRELMALAVAALREEIAGHP